MPAPFPIASCIIALWAVRNPFAVTTAFSFQSGQQLSQSQQSERTRPTSRRPSPPPQGHRHQFGKAAFRRLALESSVGGEDAEEQRSFVGGPTASSEDDPVVDVADDEFEFDEAGNNSLLDEDESSMGAWVPVGSISCLKGVDPLPVEIMGRTFVVWEGTGGRWSVLKDECPHRQVPLSQGRVDPKTRCLECAFHGWQFNESGTLVRIPHLEADRDLQPEARSVESYGTHVTGDLLWVFLPTLFHGESFPRTLLPEHYYHGLQSFVNKRATFYTQEMPFSFDFFVEKCVAVRVRCDGCCLECPCGVQVPGTSSYFTLLRRSVAAVLTLCSVLDGPAHAYFAHNAFGFRREEVRPLPVRIPVSNFTELMTEVSYTRQRLERRYVACLRTGCSSESGGDADNRAPIVAEDGGTATSVPSWR